MKTGDSAVKNVPAMHWGDAGSIPSQEDSLENQKTEYSTFSNYNFNIRKACETFIERGKSWLSVKPQKKQLQHGSKNSLPWNEIQSKDTIYIENS